MNEGISVMGKDIIQTLIGDRIIGIAELKKVGSGR